jgi:hypothetical protein
VYYRNHYNWKLETGLLMQQLLQFDDDHGAEVDALVEAVLAGVAGLPPQHAKNGRAGDPGFPGWPLPIEAAKLLRALRSAHGAKLARPIRELVPLLDLSEREVKQAARTLVVEFGLPVVGLRVKPYGYYLAVTTEERLAAANTLKHEIRALARRVRALEGHKAMVEWLGQLQIELNGPPEAA